MRYPIIAVDIERNDKLSYIAPYKAYAANNSLHLQLKQAVYRSRSLYRSDSAQYVISQFEVGEYEI
jgi:hypothetical protein